MRRLLRIGRRRPSPAMVVACMALFIALGGTSYAVTKIRGDQIVKRTIDGSKLEVNTVGAKEIRESGLKTTFAGLADNAIALGGTPAAAYPRNVEVVTVETALNSTNRKNLVLPCPGDKIVIAGGAEIQATNEAIALSRTTPTDDRKSWVGEAFETAGTQADWILKVSAVCGNR